MKFKMGREIALLTLPIVILGGVALWSTYAPRSRNELPIGITKGAPRVEWDGFRVIPPTSAEAARGLTVHLKTTLWNGGEMPDLSVYRGFHTYVSHFEQQLHLTYRQKEKLKRYVAPDGTSGVRLRIEKEEVPKGASQPQRANWQTDIYLPLAALPGDATDVQLEGHWQAQWLNTSKIMAPASLSKLGKWDGRYWQLQTQSKAFAVQLDTIDGFKARAGKVPDVSRNAAVSLVKAEVQSLPQGVSDGGRPSEAGDARIVVTVNAPVGRVRWKNNRPHVLEYRLYDEHGREWTKPSGGLQQPEWGMESSGISSGGFHPKGEFWLDTPISLAHIPASAGKVRMKIWISDDSQSWPLVVEREVRPKWIYGRTSSLKIESVRVVKTEEIFNGKDNTEFTRPPGEMRNRVEVVVRYLGTKRPVPRGFRQNAAVNPIIKFWQWDPAASYSDYGSGQPMPITPRDEDLIFDWSQRVLTARGTVVKTKPGGWNMSTLLGPPRIPQKLDLQGKRWVVRYDLHRLPPLIPGEKYTFRAQLGIAGEGFVTAELPLNSASLR